jgi:hypothetical protein
MATSFDNCTWTKERSYFKHPEHILCDDTNMVLTSFPNIYAKCPIWMSSNMEKVRMLSMGSTTNLFICSNKMDSYVAGTRQKYWSDRKEWWCNQVKTTSRNTIKIVLGTEFDLTIAQTQIKDWKDSISKEEILSCFNTKKTRHPFKRNRVR